MKELKRYYQYGSVAEDPKKIFDDPTYEQRRREEKRRKIREQNARRRAHKRSLRAARLKLFSATFSIALLGGMLFFSVYLQNMVNDTKKSISSLEDQITVLNEVNAATKSRIETAVNLNVVKEKALQDMGMVYAGSDHIVYYDIGNTDYMVKY